MNALMYAVAGALILSATAVSAEPQGKGREQHQVAVDDDRDRDSGDVRGAVHVVFSRGDVDVIREYYAPRHRNLPPGLRKKLARGGQLPPGWQKKMEPFPVELERRLAVLPAGYQRGVIDGHAVIYLPGTSVMIDATVLF